MPLIKVRYQDWEANFAYAPPLLDAIINSDDVISAVPVESRGQGPFLRVNLRDGTHLTIQGRPEDLLTPAGKEH